MRRPGDEHQKRERKPESARPVRGSKEVQRQQAGQRVTRPSAGGKTGTQETGQKGVRRIPGWTEDRERTGNEVWDRDRGWRTSRPVLDRKSGLRPPELRPGTSPKDKHHPEAEVTSAALGQWTGDPGGVCKEQKRSEESQDRSKPSNRSRQVRMRWLNQTGAERASNKGQEAEGSGKAASDKSREGIEGRDWPSPGLGVAPEVHRGPRTNIGESGGQMSDEIPVFSTVELDRDSWARPGVRGSSGELTEVRPVVEASSEASPDGNSDLEVGSGKNPECQGVPGYLSALAEISGLGPGVRGEVSQ
ncbi:hypothetical protein BKA82DRAFT_4018835 [Pisolithus tinctorius]|nr:hypothetical protein BKA82DRAFT_4018835 [Pisolithus tinctorius]